MSSDGSVKPPRVISSHPPAIFTFHKVTSRFTFGSTNYSPRRLRRLLTLLVNWGYRLQSVDQALQNQTPLSAAVTFDDGYNHLVDILPVLMDEYGLRPLVFVPTAFIGRPNSWDYSHRLRTEPHLDTRNIAALAARGVEFGSHGHRHVDLTRCDARALRAELTVSKSLLEDITGSPVTCISYPFGRYNQQVLEAVRESGYRKGFTMKFPEVGDSRLTIGRYGVYGYDTAASIRRRLSRGRLYRLEKWKADLTNRLSGGTSLWQRLRPRPSADVYEDS